MEGVPNGYNFFLLALFTWDMKHMTSTQIHSHFPHNLWGLYIYPIHYQIDHVPTHPPTPLEKNILNIEPIMVILFEHAIQSPLKMCIFSICYWSHAKLHTTQYIGVLKKIQAID